MEKIFKPASGWLMLFVMLAMIAAAIFLASQKMFVPAFILAVIALAIIAPGFLAIEPNSTRVLTLFGTYIGSAKESGFYFANPFFTKKKVSLRAVVGSPGTELEFAL